MSVESKLESSAAFEAFDTDLPTALWLSIVFENADVDILDFLAGL